MPDKQLADVADEETVFRLNSLKWACEFAAPADNPHWNISFAQSDPEIDVGQLKVWGVREAKSSFSQMLNGASTGQIYVITSGRGDPVVVMSAERLAGAMAVIEQQRGLTLSDAMKQLPFDASELMPFALRGNAPASGLLRRALTREDD